MHKQFLLLFIVIINVSIYSQVVIKDEIVLDENNIYQTGTESTGLTTPFYGKVKETILTGTIVCHISRTALIVNGAEYPFGPCWTWNCAPYSASCFCVAGNPATERTNIPAYTNVGTRFLKCKNVNGQYVWVELEHYYEIETSNENYQQYKIYSRVDAISNWQHVGWMEFNKTTPPLCCATERSCVDECEQPFNTPNLDTDSIPNAEACNDTVDDPAGVFKGLYWELREGEELTLTPCQDPMTGDVKFKYSTNLTDEIYVPYNLELCPDNIAYLNLTRIDDLEEFEEYLNIKFPPNDPDPDPNIACSLRQAILGHQGIDANGNQTGKEIFFQGWIWLTVHSLTHEAEHKRDYINELNDSKRKIFDKFYINYALPCSTYLLDTEGAKTIATGDFRAELTIFSKSSKSNYDSKLNEVEVNGRQKVLDSIKPYLIRLDKLIRKRFDIQTALTIINYCN